MSASQGLERGSWPNSLRMLDINSAPSSGSVDNQANAFSQSEPLPSAMYFPGLWWGHTTARLIFPGPSRAALGLGPPHVTVRCVSFFFFFVSQCLLFPVPYHTAASGKNEVSSSDEQLHFQSSKAIKKLLFTILPIVGKARAAWKTVVRLLTI